MELHSSSPKKKKQNIDASVSESHPPKTPPHTSYVKGLQNFIIYSENYSPTYLNIIPVFLATSSTKKSKKNKHKKGESSDAVKSFSVKTEVPESEIEGMFYIPAYIFCLKNLNLDL